jgi:peptide/nickel transport system permease protein
VSTFLALLLAATPSFWLSMSCIFLFALKLGWFPAFGSDTPFHFVLPALSLGIPYAAGILRHCRSSMLDCVRQDYVDTAKSKGIPKRRVVWKHAFNNAVLPVITSAGGSFGALIGGAVVTEQLYGISGLGTLLSAAIKSRDVPLVCGTVVVIACIFSLVMLGVDLLHAAIDPRVRARYSKG